MKKKKHDFVKLPSLSQRRKVNKYYSPSLNDGPNPEVMKLESLWLSEASRRVHDEDNNTISQEKSRQKKTKKVKKHVYLLENERLRGKQKQQKKLISKKKDFAPFRPIDKLIELERRNTMAASIIQHHYRAYQRRQFWKLYFIKTKAAKDIQRIVRGVLCRKLVRQWFLQRDFLANKIQAFVRGCMTRMILRTMFAWELRNAIVLQSVIRRYLAIKRYRTMKYEIAALQIQSMWRGSIDRAIVTGIKLSKHALKIQSCYRKFLAVRIYRKLEKEYRISAILIQKTFRGTVARQNVRTLLLARERINTQTILDMLQVEEEWRQDHIVRLRRRLERLDLQQQIEKLEKSLKKKREAIYQVELSYLDLKKQKDRASPRAIAQGWLNDIGENLKKFRIEITEKKCEAIFDVTRALRFRVEKLAEKEREIREYEIQCDQLQKWRTQELMDLWEREAEQGWGKKRDRKARAIAEQKRRWRVKFYTSNGKPDMRRKDGYPWDPSVYAGPERDDSATNLHDILAFCNGNPNSEFGGKMSTLMSQLQVVNATAQKQRNEAIVNPLLNIVEKRYNTINERGGHVNTADEIAENRMEIAERRQLQDKMKQVKAELDKRAEELNQVKEKAEFSEKPDQMKKAHVPWELLDQLAAEQKKLQAEKAIKLLFNH